jgi:hypothetical protein
MNRSIDASAAQQRFVGGVDNCIHVKRGNIALNDFNARIHWQPFMEYHQSAGSEERTLTENLIPHYIGSISKTHGDEGGSQ